MTNKIKDTLKNHKYLLLSFFLPLLILEGIAIAEKIQPFGSGSFLIVDALHQYLPFFADYQEKLKHMDYMFYSFRHFILENVVEKTRFLLLHLEWHMDYAVIW